MHPIVAIDGPAGSGKSTVARALARALGLPHLDTGAVYRALAAAALNARVAADDVPRLVALAIELDVSLDPDGVRLDGDRPGLELRTREVGIVASQVSVHPEVRRVLVAKQRAALDAAGGVAEGRDIGTVVAPDAPLKVFLTATPRERAIRRSQELRAAGERIDLDALADEIAERDERDRTRAASPLRPADDAIVVDTTGRDADEVVAELRDEARRRGLAGERS